MRVGWIALLALSAGRPKTESEVDVDLPRVPPDTAVMSWSVISRSADRDSIHAVLEASRKLTTTKRVADGTMISVSRTVSKAEYAALVGKLRALDCCSLSSTTAERSDPAEAKPLLEIDFGDTRCEVELWDREWREGLARECALAAARLHRADVVPDPPVDEPPR